MRKRKEGVVSILLSFMLAVGFFIPSSIMQVFAEDSVTCEIKASKVFENGTLEEGQFEFTITPVDGAPAPEKTTAKNDANGNISFGNATFTTPDTYKYLVKEKKGSDRTITYDTEEKTITVTVTAGTGTSGPRAGVGGYTPQKHDTVGERVTYDHAGGAEGAYSDKTVTFIHSGNVVEHVFCGDRGATSSSRNYQNRTVWKGNGPASEAGTGCNWDENYIPGNLQSAYYTWLDRVAYMYSYDFFNGHLGNSNHVTGYMWSVSENPGVLTGDTLYKAIQTIMFNAYPYNAAGLDENGLGNFTQQAIWFTMQYGKGYKDSTYNIDINSGGYKRASGNEEAFEALIKYAIKGETTSGYDLKPGEGQVYVYWNTTPLASNPDVVAGAGEHGFAAQPLLGIYAEDDGSAKATATTAEFTNIQNDEVPGILKTTVSCGGSTASSSAPAEVVVPEGGTTKDVVDKIDYENLVGGATYKVQGTLMDVTDASNPTEVTKSNEKECVANTNGSGSWEITFKSVKLEPGKTYVVYEFAQMVKDADGNPVTDGTVITHENPDDKAQTIVVKATNIKISTKVENQYISPAANQSFTDTVTFEGLEEGKTYTIKGVVKNQKDESDVAAECEPAEVDSSINQHGMQFRGIDASKFNDGDKLVVFEYLYEGSAEETKDFKPGDGKEVANHTDINDEAQTVTIVDGQIKLEKTTAATSVKPGDVVPYTITVTNERKVPATVQIVDNPETGLKYVEASDNGVYDSDVNTVVWDGLEVPANGSVSVDVFFSITEDASGKVTNRAHVFEPENPENVLGAYEDASDVKVLGAYEGDNKKSKGANTGDDAPLGIAMIVLLAAAGGFELIRRRRTN